MQREARKKAAMFTIVVKHPGGAYTWEEDYVEVTPNPYRFVKNLIDNFNAGCMGGQQKREVVAVKLRGRCDPVKHQWTKTSLVTQKRGARYFDTYQCDTCQITARRYGIGGPIIQDKQYKGEAFQRCDNAVLIMQKRREWRR